MQRDRKEIGKDPEGMEHMEQIRQKAYAKINLGLDVIRKREDGYHEVKMIMQTIDLCDDLILEKCPQKGIFLQIDDEELPCDHQNLVYRAAELMMQEKQIEEGVKITLTKRIPIAAGMAGGSSDAAATLRGMNELFELGYQTKELQELGLKLGADIPYCIVGGTMLSEGIGELLTVLPAPPQCVLVIAKPEAGVSTKYVYEHLHVDTLQSHPDIDGMIEAVQKGSLQGVTERMANVLETVTVSAYPVIAQIKALLQENGAENALMSGSGPTVFGVFTERETAQRAAELLQTQGLAKQVFVTGFKNR